MNIHFNLIESERSVVKTFLSALKELGDIEELKGKLKRNIGVQQVSGCIDAQKPHLIYGLGQSYRNKLVITYSETRAKELYEDYKFYDKQVLLYPAKDLIFYNADIHGNLLVKQRMEVLKALLEARDVTVITTIDGCMDHLLPFEEIEADCLTIRYDSMIDVTKMERSLTGLGYERMAQVEGPGQFAVRGGIIDIYPLTAETPVRIELWGDEVDSIRSIDIDSQRSIENIDEMKIYPAAELLFHEDRIAAGLKRIKKEAKEYQEALKKQKKMEEASRIQKLVAELTDKLTLPGANMGLDGFVCYFCKETVSLLDYFAKEDTLIFLDEPNRLIEKGSVVEQEFRESMVNRLEKGYILPGQARVLFSYSSIVAKCNLRNCISLCTLEPRQGEWHVTGTYGLTVKSVNPYNNSFELLVKDLKGWKKNGYRVILLSGSRTRAVRLASDLLDYELNSFYTDDPDRLLMPGEVMVLYGKVRGGFEYPLIKFVVISESDIFGREKKKKKKRKVYEGQKIQSFTELNIGDFVVHENHGVGIYRGIEKVEMEDVIKDYIKIEYKNGGNLYILATQLDLIQKYAGADARQPRLNRLGGQEWNKTKTRVRTAVKEIAKDLVNLYAVRQASKGYVYDKDTVWQKEFEELFMFEETEDQLLAIDAVKRDMESQKIMDRLICGDVGYGKTEIAIRAAFKAVQEGKQVAYLVPTTILAQQHYNNFVQRMKEFPVVVDLLCRFRTPAQQKVTITNLKKGLADIVIGTHRLLSKDVQYKDLGLLIIDEEQRFGVTHKEKIKQLKQNVDVLTLTATPIPRTLHMSLIGIRDMSVLEEPPMDRTPIQTFVMEYNEEMVREAISRELARGGQVYYVYNRVSSIDELTGTIARLVPEANVAFAHGQMRERQLETIMYDFINGEIDVLVSTTIIETGMDISNVNTMIIHDADQLGLSQLYQLRGRVGRSNRTAYAFLMYRRNKMLKEVAEKRLQAIREFTELGSGFKIAMRDLEIRGAGNLLGAQQHGHMEAVGYDLFCKMLNEAVKEQKGIAVQPDFETSIDLDIDAFIPESYIKSEFQKLDIYKRIAGIENEAEYDDILEELMDRFGELPRPVQNLLFISSLKALAHSLYIKEILQRQDYIKIVMYEKAEIKVEKIPDLLGEFSDELEFKIESQPYFIYRYKKKSGRGNEEVLQILKQFLESMKTQLHST